MTSTGREFALMLGGGAAGVAVVLLAAAQQWARASFAPLLPLPAATVGVTGHELAPAAAALGLAALACLAAVLATRGAARRMCGGLLAALGVLAAAAAAGAVGRAHLASAAASYALAPVGPPRVALAAFPWWVASVGGGLLIAAAGVLAAWRGTRWPGMSSRYDRPPPTRPSGSGGGPAGDPVSVGPSPAPRAGHDTAWDVLDAGGDPTVSIRTSPTVSIRTSR
jgi:uncharacterized membrane protein (TIGR02234 family)